MEKPRPSTVALLCGGLVIAGYEYWAPQDELLSEAFDRGLQRPLGRFAVIGSTLAVTGHLLNVIPEEGDVFHYISKYFNREKQT